MNGGILAGAILASLYFVVLVVVALEPHESGRQARHRRDPITGAGQ